MCFLDGAMSVALLRSDRGGAADRNAAGALVLISLAFFFYTNATEMGNASRESRENVREPARDEVRRMEAFAEDFSLTEREKEVLHVLLVSEENVQDIAEQLLISGGVYRHIASLNEKTGTKSRIGLVQFYYTYQGRTGNERKRQISKMTALLLVAALCAGCSSGGDNRAASGRNGADRSGQRTGRDSCGYSRKYEGRRRQDGCRWRAYAAFRAMLMRKQTAR